MARTRVQFVCRSCGGVQPKWMGKCPDCGAWDALEQFREARAEPDKHAQSAAGWGQALPGHADHADQDDHAHGVHAVGDDPSHGVRRAAQGTRGAVLLGEIDLKDSPRVPTGVAEFDRVLGGGLVPGSVILLGGDPGIGKSTLLLQGLAGLADSQTDRAILYVSSEESARQIRLRANRLIAPAEGGFRESGEKDEGSLSRLHVLAESNLAKIVEQARRLRPAVCAIDSIQMVYRGDLDAAPGSVAQLRRCCTDLVYLAKRSGMAIIVVGHVTKDGQLAGPKLLEHLVDVVLSFEGERHHAYRLVRAIKNRFGSTQEIGLFEMTETGLREVAHGAVIDPTQPPPPGTAICPTILGSRCLLAEIQALTATGILGAARRKSSGVDGNRMAMLIAVLEKHGGLRLADQDIFVAAADGLRVVEPAADLAMALAIAGIHANRRMPAGVAALGEIALTGQIRPVPLIGQRIREALRLGLRSMIVPKSIAAADITGVDPEAVLRVASIGEALEVLETKVKESGGSARRPDFAAAPNHRKS